MPARPRRERPQPTGRGTAIGAFGLIAFGVGLLLHRADAFLIGLLLVLVVAGSLLSLLSSGPPPTAHRMIRPDAVNAGEDATVAVVVRSGGGRPIPPHRWRDTVPAALTTGRIGEPGPLPGDPDAAVLRYPIHAAGRGRYEIGPLRVTRTDPLGLAMVELVLGGPEVLLVRPRVTPLADSPLDESAVGGADLVVMRRTTPAVDEVSARDYERGDPMRRVNWHASAKRGRLMVRLEEQRAAPQSRLLLDTIGRAGDRNAAAFELGIELAASIGVHAIGAGFALGVLETGLPQLDGDEGGSRTAGFTGTAGGRLLVAQLAAIAPAAPAAGAIAAFGDELRRAGADTPGFAILVGAPTAVWSELVGLHRLADPAIAFLLTPEAAAARAELERSGWICVGVEPGTGPAEAWAAASESVLRRAGMRRV